MNCCRGNGDLKRPKPSPRSDTRSSAHAYAAMAKAGGIPEPYLEQFKAMIAERSGGAPDMLTYLHDVTRAIWRAVTDPNAPVAAEAPRTYG